MALKPITQTQTKYESSFNKLRLFCLDIIDQLVGFY